MALTIGDKDGAAAAEDDTMLLEYMSLTIILGPNDLLKPLHYSVHSTKSCTSPLST